MKKVITISRQYGSGGREIGAKLAAQLGIPFYDNELITRAAKESGFAEAAFENAENKASNSLLYSIAMGMNSYGNQELGFSHLSLDDRIYLAQADVIRKVAAEGPCVIVGRCADYILKDLENAVHILYKVSTEIPFLPCSISAKNCGEISHFPAKASLESFNFSLHSHKRFPNDSYTL